MLKLSFLNTKIVSFLAKPPPTHTNNINWAKKNWNKPFKSTQFRAFVLVPYHGGGRIK